MYNKLCTKKLYVSTRSKDISPLLDRMIVYDFLPIVNNYLLSEIFEAVVSNAWMNKYQAEKLIAFIKKISLLITEKRVFALSPYVKDNYLFDPAIQNNCVFIISDDSRLLDFLYDNNSHSFIQLVYQ